MLPNTMYKLAALALLLLFTRSTLAAAADVSIYASYALGAAASDDTIAFDITTGEVVPKGVGRQEPSVYADKMPLVRPGAVLRCDVTQVSISAFVRIWLTPPDVVSVNTIMLGWTMTSTPNRVLAFVRKGRLVYGHAASLATVSESMLYLHVGAYDEAQSILETICGDA